MLRRASLLATGLGLAIAVAAAPAVANVKVTPLGTHDGEFCVFDRALLFEDPDGTTVLYDAGRSVRGPDDPRLGEVDIVLLSHVHGDHLGDRVTPEANAGACGSPQVSVAMTPNSNTAEIAAKKGSRVIVGGEMHEFLQRRVVAAGGKAEQVNILRFGGKRTVGGVTVALTPAVHSDGAAPAFVEGPLGEQLSQGGLTAYVGPSNGYVLTFSNGLVVYLSGDTGITSDMDTVVRRYYGAELAVINIGDIFTTGPEEAAWAVKELIKPRAVIPSHANEAATQGGKPAAGTKTAKFIELTSGIPSHVPLSGRTMEFDGDGNCVAGC